MITDEPFGKTYPLIVFEAEKAAVAGGREIDVVVDIGKALGGDWDYVAEEIRAINEAVLRHGAILRVISENDYMQDEHIVQLCKIWFGTWCRICEGHQLGTAS